MSETLDALGILPGAVEFVMLGVATSLMVSTTSVAVAQ